MLCGLLTPDEGRGTCLGYDILTETDKIKLQVGYMTQRFSLYQDLSVRENLEFVARLYDIADPVGAARQMVDRLGLKGREEQLAGSLSGGWKQRLALGACTLPNPELLLLDEPTAGVDPGASAAIMETITRLNRERGLTVVLVTHHLRLLRPVVQSVIWVESGSATKGPPEVMLAPERIADVFGAVAAGG